MHRSHHVFGGRQQERKIDFKVDFIHAVLLEEFLVSVDDDKVVGDMELKVREVVEGVHAVLDEFGIECAKSIGGIMFD